MSITIYRKIMEMGISLDSLLLGFCLDFLMDL
jgi:hypothetical protein